MIPSDHFVKFYNEVFKFLDARGPGHLEKYWLTISHHQELHCLELFKTKGLQGMYEYWEHIRIEENCDMTLTLTEDCLTMKMHKCPSLGKVLDNDAIPCEKYCDHCAGWIGPLLTKAGYWLVYDMVDRHQPQCQEFIYEDLELAKQKRDSYTDKSMIICNF
ncbi:MAG: hypothetical protein L3J71_18510 [Victivallaceae bacterium]|nr:hypothetical protein [Victivallaceae bacterium]